MTKERLLEFLQEHIFPKYKNNLIILDNARSHNNELIKMLLLKVEMTIYLAFLIHQKQTQ